MSEVFLDFETRSPVNLGIHGAPRYHEHPHTTILCAAWSVDRGPVQLWRPGKGSVGPLARALSEATTIHAHNAAFELACLNGAGARAGLPTPSLDVWRCTAAKAAYGDLPRALGKLSERLKLGDKAKDKAGKALIQKCCNSARKGGASENEEDLAALAEYCRQDVVAEMAADERTPEWPELELDIWRLDRKINSRGVPVDVEFCSAAAEMAEEIVARNNERLEEVTGGEVHTVGQVQKIKEWLIDRGLNIDNTQAGTLEAELRTCKDEAACEVMRLRLSANAAATKKYRTTMHRASEDGRVREHLMYYGASSTGRWASPGVQYHNLYRGAPDEREISLVKSRDVDLLQMVHDDPMAVLQTNVRGVICAEPGKTLAICDFGAIEGRIAPWVANCFHAVRNFKRFDAAMAEDPKAAGALEPYRIMAGRVFTLPPSEIGKGPKRNLGKVGVLSAQFGVGAQRFMEQAHEWGCPECDLALAERAVAIFRKDHPEIVQTWYALEGGFRKMCRGASKAKVNNYVWWEQATGDAIALRLPNGRKLHYNEPRYRGGRCTYRSAKGALINAYGSFFFENVVQAAARDVLKDALLECDRRGHEIVHHIHDEIVLQVDQSDADAAMADLYEIMTITPEWLKGCPLAAEGHLSRRLSK